MYYLKDKIIILSIILFLFLEIFDCGAHCMHLINQKANKEIPEKVEKFVKDVCSDIKTSK
jgi:hypothetical protein